MSGMVSSLLMIFLSLATGYGAKRLIDKRDVKLPFSIPAVRIFFQKLVLIGFIPVTVTTSVWIAPIKNLEIIALPFLGITALATGSFIALGLAGTMKKSRRDRAVLFISGGFSNMGSLGGLLSFLFLGEAGFALVSFYIFLERIWYFGVGFPYARSCSIDEGNREKSSEILKRMFIDPFVLTTLLSMSAGIILNLAGLSRPTFFQSVNALLVPLGTVLLLFSIGLGMRLSAVKNFWREGLGIVIIKAMIIPLLIVSLASLLGLGEVAGGLPLKVVLILASMPVGFTALVPPSIYDLDLDLANSIWLISNGALLIIIPLLSFLVPII